MKKNATIIGLVLTLFISLVSCNTNTVQNTSSHIPSIDEMAGDWVSTDTVAMEPSIRNFQGQALANRDLTSISWLAAAPYSGGYHTGTMRVNGTTPIVKEFKWEAHQALRRTTLNNVDILSTTRMVPHENTILWEVEFTNNGSTSEALNIEQDHIGFVGKYDSEEWQWWYPYPTLDGKITTRTDETDNIRKHMGQDVYSMTTEVFELVNGKPQSSYKTVTWPTDQEILDSEKYTANISNDVLVVSDTETPAKAAFRSFETTSEMIAANSGGTSTWNFTLEPGATKTIRFAMAFGDSEEAIINELNYTSESFAQDWNNVKSNWETKWADIFTTDSDILSGTFPVLETEDEDLRQVYYKGPLTMLYLMHTNLPQHEKVFLTGGPRWGASITFYWDITEWATMWSVVDPEMMKEHLSSWIKIDPSKYYGQDNFGGAGVGNGYSANYWALFQMIRSYITASGDIAFLDQEIDGKTVLQHIENYAYNWKQISIFGKDGADADIYKLADFGDDEWNLLECVPTYKHIVPSFNAGYIWMMRETAAFHELKGNLTKATAMKEEATDLIAQLLKLYAGNGVWNSLYPDGSKIEVRHCLDFMFLGRYMPNDIPADIKKDMMDFVYRELITDNWMRAQSLNDVAAENSDRPDHGPMGAFAGWPAGTMDALTQLGFPEKALDFYYAITPVTDEGIWAQAHELYGDNKKEKSAKVRIAERGWHNRESSAGVAMSQVMLKNFFGFNPKIDGTVLQQNENFDFNGVLHHVKYNNEYYRLEAKDGKVTMIKESK